MASNILPQRSFTCFSPTCDGATKGIDTKPKKYGRAAVCWCCGSDLYTMPRFGAPDDALAGREDVKRQYKLPGSSDWHNSFGGMRVTRPDGAQD